ncbi:MAG: hypothetical protein ACRCXX_05920 [Cetobacterium sp.]
MSVPTSVNFTENIFKAKEFETIPSIEEILELFALSGLWYSDKFSHHVMECAKSDAYTDTPHRDDMSFDEMDSAIIRAIKTRVIEIQKTITEVSSKCI